MNSAKAGRAHGVAATVRQPLGKRIRPGGEMPAARNTATPHALIPRPIVGHARGDRPARCGAARSVRTSLSLVDGAEHDRRQLGDLRGHVLRGRRARLGRQQQAVVARVVDFAVHCVADAGATAAHRGRHAHAGAHAATAAAKAEATDAERDARRAADTDIGLRDVVRHHRLRARIARSGQVLLGTERPARRLIGGVGCDHRRAAARLDRSGHLVLADLLDDQVVGLAGDHHAGAAQAARRELRVGPLRIQPGRCAAGEQHGSGGARMHEKTRGMNRGHAEALHGSTP